MKVFDCQCGTHLEADADDDLLAIARQHVDDQHAGDPMYSDMELEAQIERSAHEEEDR
jgi:predicted small metal-binding protein